MPLKVAEKSLRHSCAILAFSLFCFMIYEQAIKKRESDFVKLLAQKQELENQKKAAIERRTFLLLQVNSESDPVWVELMLMQTLGLVPEGQKKFFFTSKE